MPGKVTPAKLTLLAFCAGLAPCVAAAVDMPANPLSEAVDTTHLGEIEEGVTARTQAGWSVQVGAYADKGKAEARLDELASERPGELRHAARLVMPFKSDDTHMLYRARFADLSLDAASALCASLNGAGQACFLAQTDNIEKPALRQAAVASDDRRGAGFEAPAMLVASTAALTGMTMDAPRLSAIVEEPVKAMAPRLVALNDKLAVQKSELVSNSDLSGMRGGFFTAAGAQFDFGASIKTMVNGQLALQTNLTWTPKGPDISSLSGLGQKITDQVRSQLAQAGIGSSPTAAAAPAAPANPAADLVNAANATAATPASALADNPTSAARAIATPAASLATGAVSSALDSAGASGAPAAATTPKTSVTIPTLVSGVNIPGPSGGSTQVLANIGANQIQSIILNSASNQIINQNTNVTLTIYNLPQWQQQLAQHALSSQLAGEIMAASGLGH